MRAWSLVFGVCEVEFLVLFLWCACRRDDGRSGGLEEQCTKPQEPNLTRSFLFNMSMHVLRDLEVPVLWDLGAMAEQCAWAPWLLWG